MVKTVIREHHYSPQVIDGLYLDDIDYHGLVWLYNDIKQVHSELKEK